MKDEEFHALVRRAIELAYKDRRLSQDRPTCPDVRELQRLLPRISDAMKDREHQAFVETYRLPLPLAEDPVRL